MGSILHPRSSILVGCAAAALLLVAVIGPASVQAADWPYYRGLNHDGISADPILAAFPPEGPPQVWKVPLEAAFSSFTVSGGRAFTQVRRVVAGEDREVCIALSVTNGTELWATPLDTASYPDGSAGLDDGPRSTPCVDASFVYVLSSYLKLAKLDAASGAVIWQKDLLALYGGQTIRWQNAASPLIDGDLIFLNCNSPTNCLLALRKTDASLVWRSGTGALTHATPVPATILGVRQIIFFTESGLVAVARETGDELWRYPFPFNTSTAASPVVDGDIVYCSAAWGIGAGAVRIASSGGQFTATEIWRDSTLMNEWSTPVCCGGYLYGLFGRYYNSTAPLKCIDLATGAEMWSQPGFGPGGVLLVDGKLLVTDGQGGVVLVEAYPRTYNELARFQAVSGKCWNCPAIGDGCLYARSTTEAACLNLGAPAPPAGLVPSLERRSDGGLCLRVNCADGNPIDPSRLAGIEIRTATDLVSPISNWLPVTNNLALTNGVIELSLEALDRERYFIVTEQPSTILGPARGLKR